MSVLRSWVRGRRATSDPGQGLYFGVERPELVLDPLVCVDGPDGVLEGPPDQGGQPVPEHGGLSRPYLVQEVERLGEPSHVELEGVPGEVGQPDEGHSGRGLGPERRHRRSRLLGGVFVLSVDRNFQLKQQVRNLFRV